MNNKQDITDVWKLYESGVDFNNRINYYYQTERNFRFYKGEQWIGVEPADLPTPVFNIFKPIFNYFISAIMSQKVTGQYAIMNVPDAQENIDPNMVDPQQQKDQEYRDVAEFLTKYAETKWESDKMDMLLQDGLLDACLTGDVCAYTYWDDSIDSGQDAKGDYKTELVDSCNVMFGNANNNKVESQPYILILGRQSVKSLKSEAKANKVSKDLIETIKADNLTEYQAGDTGKIEIENKDDSTGKALYVLKFWKENNTVWWSKSTKHCDIREAVDLDVRCYPIAWMNWENVKNCYHGQSPASHLINNQIYINKQFAMTMLWLMYSAYGKVIYDSTKVDGWSNQIGTAQPINGDINGAVQQLQPGSMNNVVLEMIDKTIQYTKDLAGANDGALGNVNPEQASGAAIIAVQKQASIPLESIQRKLWQFVEDIHRIWGEFALRKYTANRKLAYKDKEKTMVKEFNSEPYSDLLMNVKVNVGASSYWSEVTSIQALDNLLTNNRIDMLQYLDRIPNGIIPKKNELMEEIKQQQQAQQQMQQQQQQAQIEQQQGQQMAQQQQMEQQQAMEQEQQSQEEQAKNQQYEQMANFVEQLPPEVQQQLQQLPPDEMERMTLQMMKQAVSNSMKGG